MEAGLVAICYDVERPLARQQQPTPEGLQIAGVFKKLRTEAGLTQEDVARKIDLTLSGYRPYEQGRRQLRTEQIPLFARAFKVSVESLAVHLGLSAADVQQVRVSECTELMSQLDGEPPEVIETVMRFWRESIELAKSLKRAD